MEKIMCLVSFSKIPSYSSKQKVDSFDGMPKWGYVDITSKCSHGCAWCYGGFNENLTSEMSVDEFKDVVQKLKQMGLLQLTITGGEPTEHPNFYKIVELATSNFDVVHVCSHGDWDTNHAKKLSNLGVKQVQFNYQGEKRHDGIHKVEGSYSKQLNSIQQCIDAGIETVCTVTVGAYNLSDIDITFKEIAALGVDRIRIWEATGKGNKWKKDKEAIEIFEKCSDEASKLGYTFIQNYDPEFDGDVNAPCPAMIKMFMYVNSKSQLVFCPATDQLLEHSIACFKSEPHEIILDKYVMFMDNIRNEGLRCVAREEQPKEQKISFGI
jgi:MoaA/NifB/PqqE/SkfB family radical SAM enzyme